MPGFDKTGPAGAGPRTGRGMGPCSGYRAGCPYCGTGFGRGGFGFRRQWLSPKNNLKDLQDEQTELETEINDLMAEKEAVKREIEELKKQADKK